MAQEKSSTLKAISGLLPPSSGSITFEGEDITLASPQRILSMGIAHCRRGRRVFPQMSVQENLEIGAFRRRDREPRSGATWSICSNTFKVVRAARADGGHFVRG